MHNHARQSLPRPLHRGFTLLAVLVIVGSALLVATSMLFIAQAEAAGASHTQRVAQSRAMMESALQIIIMKLNEQRDVILAGEQPELDEQYELWDNGGMLGVVRVLPVTPDQQRLDPQAAKIDLNAPWLTAEMLSATGMIEHDIAQAILQHRNSGMFHSVAELLEIEGITAEMLYGPVDDLVEDNTSIAEGDLAERVGERFVSAEPRGLADIVTVFAVQPELQRDGRQRINLQVPWSEQLGERLDERFGQGAGEIVKAIMEQTSFDDMAVLINVLIQFDVPTEDWPDILDALTITAEPYVFGRIDLNSASEAALLSLPEMTPEQAAAIVRSRDTLDADERATIIWPVLRGIVERQSYVQWADKLSTRSWTYRVRLATGEVDADDPTADLENPVIFEAVIDLAAPQARVAYLRDVSLMRAAAMLAVAEREGNPPGRDWYEVAEALPAELDDELLEEDALLPGSDMDTNWPDEEESWPSDDLADEIDETVPTDAPATRQRLGRWRSG